MATRRTESVRLTDLSESRLSEQLSHAIDDVSLIPIDRYRRRKHGSAMGLLVSEGDIFLDIRSRISVKKAIAILSSLIGLIWALIGYIIPHLVPLLTTFPPVH